MIGDAILSSTYCVRCNLVLVLKSLALDIVSRVGADRAVKLLPPSTASYAEAATSEQKHNSLQPPQSYPHIFITLKTI